MIRRQEEHMLGAKALMVDEAMKEQDPENLARAARLIRRKARGPEDAHLLFEALGLTEGE